jgi:hypothetical protein
MKRYLDIGDPLIPTPSELYSNDKNQLIIPILIALGVVVGIVLYSNIINNKEKDEKKSSTVL